MGKLDYESENKLDYKVFTTTERPKAFNREDNVRESSHEARHEIKSPSNDLQDGIGQRRKPIVQRDNLKVGEGEFAKKEISEFPKVEKVIAARHKDSLKSEGRFYGKRNSDFRYNDFISERVSRRQDNLQLSKEPLDFTTTQKNHFVNFLPERTKQVRYSDNLKVEEAEFAKREYEAVPLFERIAPIKHSDYLRVDGKFLGQKNRDYREFPIGERLKPINPEDNPQLTRENLNTHTMQDYHQPERARPFLQYDNIHLEQGEFTQRQIQPAPVIDKVYPVKYRGTMTMEGEFFGERNSDFKGYPIDRQKAIHQEDNIHVSGDPFDAQTMKQTQFTDFIPEARKPIIQNNNIQLETGNFAQREYQPVPSLERVAPVRHSQSLRMDGEFYGNRKSDFKEYAIERQKPIRKSDNIQLSSDPFEAETMQQSQFKNYKPEVIRPIVHKDNIQLEDGEFTKKDVQPFPNIEMVTPYRYNDSLKIDGEFFGKRNSDYSQFAAERQKPIKREDHIHLNTDPFDGLTMQQTQFINIKPEDPAKKIVPSDNLTLEEGEFTKRELAPFPTMQRSSPIKYTETLKMDGEFYGERKSDYAQYAIDKQQPIKREDHIHLSREPFEGLTMKQSQFTDFKPEVTKPIIKRDNIKLDEGEFAKREMQPFHVPEMAKPIKHNDNIKLEEGEFTRKEVQQEFQAIERPSPIRHRETLKVDGEFYGERCSDFKEHYSVERQKPIKREDYIQLSTEPFGALTMKQTQFTNFKPDAPKPILKSDHIQLEEGEFTQREMQPFHIPEAARPIKQSDNLKLEEGEFTKREILPFPVIDRASPVKYHESLKVDGEFYGERKSDYNKDFPVEKQKPIIRENNIHLSTEPFEAITMKESQFKNFVPEITKPIYHSDNITLEEGEFTKRDVQPFPKIDKVLPVKYTETIEIEGEFFGERNSDYREYHIERTKPIRQEDNIHLNTEPFDAMTMKQTQFTDYKVKVTKPIFPSDHIKVEDGQFTKREVQPFPIMERASPVKHTETLKVEGEFLGERNSDFKGYPIEKVKPIRQEDNLHLNTGTFQAVTIKQSQFTNFQPEKTKPLRVPDSIQIEQGEFTKREVQPFHKIERTSPIKHFESLKVEGEFLGERKSDFKGLPIEKPTPIRQEDNLHVSTEPFNPTAVRQGYFANFTPEKAKPIRFSDNIKVEEGEFSKREVQPFPKIERVSPVKNLGTLKPGGDIDFGERVSDQRALPIHRPQPIRYEDNLQLSTDPFDAYLIKKNEFANYKLEKPKPVRYADNLELESGEFSRRDIQAAPIIERVSPIKRSDNLQSNGEFFGDRVSEYRAFSAIEKQMPIRQEDNLHVSTEPFNDSAIRQGYFSNFRPEKAQPIRYADNLKLEQGEFSKREVQAPPQIERVSPIKQSENLKVGGDFYGERTSDYKAFPVDKQNPIRYEDNLQLSSEPFDAYLIKESQSAKFKPEKCKSVRFADNIKVNEGEFAKRDIQPAPKIERVSQIKHSDTLKSTGEFYGKRNSAYKERPIDRQRPVHHEDNIHLNTEPFIAKSIQKKEFKYYKPEITKPIIHSDNIQLLEGEFTKREIQTGPITIERVSPYKFYDTLKVDGEFYGQRKSDYKPVMVIERPKPIRAKDNITLSTAPFHAITMNQSQFVYV